MRPKPRCLVMVYDDQIDVSPSRLTGAREFYRRLDAHGSAGIAPELLVQIGCRAYTQSPMEFGKFRQPRHVGANV